MATQKYDSADTSIAQVCAIYTNFTKPKYFFSVYEGNRSSIGHPTTKGYQRNEPTINYLRFLSGFRMVTKKGKFIICN